VLGGFRGLVSETSGSLGSSAAAAVAAAVHASVKAALNKTP